MQIMIILALRNTISIMGLILALPLLAIISFFIYLEDGWPIFFKQKRLGINKEEFMIFKIRTMKKNTPELGTHDVDKSFQLRLGKVIRAIKLDELPQLINVLKGDINLVGPRPGLVTQDDLQKERYKRNIFIVKPGITGLAQILGYDMSDPAKLAEIDRIYIDNQTIHLNTLILLGTFISSFRDKISMKLGIEIRER
ncbi:sugar transferase [Gammaproteobacteria bacterium]|jgi:lipopolysaccharide/colanic/teichoic acid biosynthesis glycosyltransferase|nr:sugar transferase [Gammaproteobacteria bacterium]|tara:strand:- start:1382 stop:1972 length:591 start_codon:yes stop_codon:yes gene_type:complete